MPGDEDLGRDTRSRSLRRRALVSMKPKHAVWPQSRGSADPPAPRCPRRPNPSRHGRMMRAVQAGPVTGFVAQVLLIAALAGIAALGGVDLAAAGWVVGVTCGVITNAALARGLYNCGSDRLGPADWVTLARATLAVGVAALTAASFEQPVPVTMVVSLAVIALALDAVDGWVARRTRTTARLGARFDAEVDAFLILILSVYVASLGGRVGARDRRGTLRVPRGRVDAAVAARAAPASLLAQGRRCNARDRADHRGRRRPTADCDRGRARRRARPSCRVVRPRRVVAPEPQARHAYSGGGGCGPRPRPRSRHSRRPRTRTRANVDCRSAHDPRLPARVGRPRRS